MSKILLTLLFLMIVNQGIAQKLHKGESWKIENAQLIPNGNEIDEVALKYWSYISEVLPKVPIQRFVKSLRLFSDGEQGELAGMSPLNAENSAWEIDIDIFDFNFSNKDSAYILDYTHTLIHEFGHIISLNANQTSYTEDRKEDPNRGYLTSEGYANDKSYLGKFVNQFWRGELLREWDKIDRIRWKARKIKHLLFFYEDYPAHFLSSYAAESPEEDFAEAWTFFVLGDRPEQQEAKHNKVLFFYQFPELLEYREQIRAQLHFIPNNYLLNFRDRGLE